MSDVQKTSSKPILKSDLTPPQIAVAALCLIVAFFFLGDILRLLVLLAVAFCIGLAANRILPTKVPYGYLGSTGVGFLGAWLGTKLLGAWGPSIQGLRILPGILGALIVSIAVQYKLKADRAKSLEALKAASDPDDRFLLKELDGFILTETLGTGANSRVYLGVPSETLDPSSAVACKILNEEANKEKDTMARYGREIRIAQKLQHPGIVKMHSWGEQNKLLFFIMEYVNGGTLSEQIKPGGLALERAKKFMCQLAAALQHAHKHDIVHRDIKPANILLSNDQCKISDFGLGRALQDDVSLTKEGTVLGTPAYIAPEQIQGKRPTAACDQYALGVLFYELLTGRRPFDSSDSVALLMSHLQEAPKDPRVFREEIPEELAFLVLKMIEKKPDDRFEDLNAVLSAIHAIDENTEGSKTSPKKAAAE